MKPIYLDLPAIRKIEAMRNAGVRGGVRWLSRSEAAFQASVRRAQQEEELAAWGQRHPIETVLYGDGDPRRAWEYSKRFRRRRTR